MERPIVKSRLLLSRPSVEATPADGPIGQDLLDTLAAHKDECVGLAANMIGQLKRIIAVDDNGTPLLMFSPQITQRSGLFQTSEGCLSLPGQRPCARYRSITVSYQDASFRPRTRRFTGWTAQIIQHEVDHCQGIVI